jgi:hypothetical protein
MDETRIIAAILAAGILASFQRSTFDPVPDSKNAASIFQYIVRELAQARSSATNASTTP